MKNDELDRILKQATVPDRSEAYWATFPERVMQRVSWTPRHIESGLLWPRLPMSWAVGLAVACLCIGFLAGHLRPERGNTNAMLSGNGRVVREMLAMFPHRVRAIVQDTHGMRVELSETEDIVQSAPIWVTVSDGRHWSALVTFSGQEIQIAGQTVTVLVNSSDRVLLVGHDFVWSDQISAGFAKKLRVRASVMKGVI